MADEQQAETTAALTSPEGIAKLVERIGLPTLIIIAVSYVGWNEIVSPMASRFIAMLDGVTESNKQLTDLTSDMRDKIVEVGVRNGQVMDQVISTVKQNEALLEKIEDQVREGDPAVRRSIEAIQASLAELATLAREAQGDTE